MIRKDTAMAKRRMFSSDVVDSDQFLDMPVSARCLYYDLGMRADDDGFVSPRKVLRLTSASDDDLRILISKNFVIPFESGVIVIKDWKMNNYIQKDRYTETIHKLEKSRLSCNENGSYLLDELCIHDGYNTDTQVRLGKVSKEIYICSFDKFWEKYPKKIAKAKAEAIYKRICTSTERELLVTNGLQKYLNKWNKEKTELQYIPNPTTWLNQERWNDEVTVRPDNGFSRQRELEWEQVKENEKKVYADVMVDDGHGRPIALKDIMASSDIPRKLGDK